MNKNATKDLALMIFELERRNDYSENRNRFIREFKIAIGYWPNQKIVSTKVFRGDFIPPMKYELPSGKRHSTYNWRVALKHWSEYCE